jgi:hypothetical protein
MKGALIQAGWGCHGGESFTQAAIRPRKRLLAVIQCPDVGARFSM